MTTVKFCKVVSVKGRTPIVVAKVDRQRRVRLLRFAHLRLPERLAERPRAALTADTDSEDH